MNLDSLVGLVVLTKSSLPVLALPENAFVDEEFLDSTPGDEEESLPRLDGLVVSAYSSGIGATGNFDSKLAEVPCERYIEESFQKHVPLSPWCFLRDDGIFDLRRKIFHLLCFLFLFRSLLLIRFLLLFCSLFGPWYKPLQRRFSFFLVLTFSCGSRDQVAKACLFLLVA